MKKVFMTLAAVLMGMTAANAQLVLGGGISFGGKCSSTEKSSIYGVESKSPAEFNFGIAPKIGGMFLDQKMEAGAALSFNYAQKLEYICLYNEGGKAGKAYKDNLTEWFNWAIQPYLRGRVAYGKGFGLWIEGIASLGTVMDTKYTDYAYSGYKDVYGELVKAERTQAEIDADKKAEADANKELNYKHSVFNGGFYIRPVLTYDINEHWRLEAQLNFLKFGIEGSVETTQMKDLAENKVEKTTDSNYNFVLGVWGGNVANLGAFQIGAAYKF